MTFTNLMSPLKISDCPNLCPQPPHNPPLRQHPHRWKKTILLLLVNPDSSKDSLWEKYQDLDLVLRLQDVSSHTLILLILHPSKFPSLLNHKYIIGFHPNPNGHNLSFLKNPNPSNVQSLLVRRLFVVLHALPTWSRT